VWFINEADCDESYWVGRLRQYAHIIDKGLQRPDFSKGRGIRAYDLAGEALSHIKSREALGDPCVKWASTKVNQYEQLQSEGHFSPPEEHVPTCCAFEDLRDAIMTRRSIRNYLDAPVEADVIEAITDVLDWAPTSCHRQPGRVYATNKQDIVRQCVRLHAGAACFTDMDAPLFMVFCADMRLYSMPAELVMPYIDVALGVQNCLLVAHTLGLSLTPLTWGNRESWQECELRKLLDIPRHFQVVVSAVGGYPDRGVPVPTRKRKDLCIIV